MLISGFPYRALRWFRGQRKENLFRDSLPGHAGQNDVSGTLYTGAGYFHVWLPGPLNPPKFAGRPFSLSATVWDSAQTDCRSPCLTAVRSGAELTGWRLHRATSPPLRGRAQAQGCKYFLSGKLIYYSRSSYQGGSTMYWRPMGFLLFNTGHHPIPPHPFYSAPPF